MLKRNSQLFIYFLIWFSLGILGCNKDAPVELDNNEYIYRVPERTNDGWETDSLENVGMTQNSLTALMNALNDLNGDGNHSILIAKNGKLVFEVYFSGYSYYHGRHVDFDRNTLHHMQSSTKGITAILTGIAIEKGYINGVEDSLHLFFPEYTNRFDEQKRKITIQHMLTMTAGLSWDEQSYSFKDSRNDLGTMSRSQDYIGYLLNKSVVEEPGNYYLYNSGLPITLGVIIGQESDMFANEFANQVLFAPLGITETHWVFWHDGHPHTGGGLYLRPRDMLKLGQLVLQNGTWENEQILSEDWIEKMTTPIEQRDYYGYYWHIGQMTHHSNTITYFLAIGSGGQEISVFPDLDMVVVLTGGNYEHEFTIHPYDIYESYILPSVE